MYMWICPVSVCSSSAQVCICRYVQFQFVSAQPQRYDRCVCVCIHIHRESERNVYVRRCRWCVAGLGDALQERIYVCLYVFEQLSSLLISICMHAVCMYVCMYACMHACMHVCMYACMRACMYLACVRTTGRDTARAMLPLQDISSRWRRTRQFFIHSVVACSLRRSRSRRSCEAASKRARGDRTICTLFDVFNFFPV